MNKTKIKNFSIWARRNLIEVVAYRMLFLGIDENGIKPQMEGSTDKLKLYDMGTSKPAEVAGEDIEKRVNLANRIKDHERTSDYKTAYETMVEEIAYTWFNRLIAIRFMEVNDYLPSGVRVLSSESGKREPDIVTKAVEVAENQGFSITKEEIWKLKEANKLDELFRIMFIQQCKKLHEVLPELFDNSIDDYTELLLPISFIDDDAFIRHLVNDIDEVDFNISEQGQVEIIGWLYQYYNTEKKNAVFTAMNNKVKVSKENIAAATQLFTPDWIVRYMVENSLGRLWVDGHADTSARSEWKYYLDEAEQTPEVQAQLAEIRAGRKDLTPEQIRFIDPCMGSGHILVYAFDVLMQIYLSCGYTEHDAAQNIVRNNLWGLDLDKRAYQLAYFAVMMKTRQYDKRLWYRIEKKEFDAKLPNLSHFQDLPVVDYKLLDDTMASFIKQFENADTYGSLITIQADDEIDSAIDSFEGKIGFDRSHLEHFMQLYKILSQRYDVVCTNPPYMAMANANDRLKSYVEKNYPDTKSDFFAVFIEKCAEIAKPNGYYAMITQHAWMFLASYEKLREKLHFKTTVNMAHLGARAFDEISGEVVQTTAFVNTNIHISSYVGTYLRLVTVNGEKEKENLFLSGENRFSVSQNNFTKITGAPIAYWVSNNFLSIFNNPTISKYAFSDGQILTGNNDKYLRFLWEVCADGIRDRSKWVLHAKGGEQRRWYGNIDTVVSWTPESINHYKHDKISRFPKEHILFRKGITWSLISSNDLFSMRLLTDDTTFNKAAATILFDNESLIEYFLGFLNTKITQSILRTINPTMNTNIKDILALPICISKDNDIQEKVTDLVKHNIQISKNDWDSFETSWDFKEHPFVKWSKELWDATAIGATMQHYYGDHPKASCPLELCYLLWQGECNDRRAKLKANEEELNRIFIEIYGLQDELTPEVEDKDITVRPAELQRDMRSFVSYAVGCMFGRYSLDREGLVFAGGDFDRVYWKHKGQAPLDENGEVPFGGGYAGVSIAPYNYPRFWNDTQDCENTPYLRFAPDADNCLPITEEHFFEDDIVTQFVDFVKAVFGEESLENNLRYVAENLGIKQGGTAREKIRQYFLKEFYKDHCKVYQKCPIYWLFDTGKKNGFKALCYVHRWTVNTVGSVRIDYMHKLQRLYRNEIIRLKENIDAGEEIAKSQKRLEKITNQLHETEEYDAKIGIVVAARTEIDLDDGVKVNYDKVQTGSDGKHYQILAKI